MNGMSIRRFSDDAFRVGGASPDAIAGGGGLFLETENEERTEESIQIDFCRPSITHPSLVLSGF